jgi:hypothetical protein
MGEAWYPGADRSHEASADGGSILGGKPKLLWHDTETSSLPSYSSGSFPHFTLDPKSGHTWQHIPCSRAARALRNPDGGCQTNRWNVIQVELIGWVNKVPYHPAMGELAAWARAEHGVPATCGVELLAYDASYGNTHVRLSCTEWDGYSGHLFHMSAPENDHGDPGKPFPIDQILAAAGGEEPDEMTDDEFLAALKTTSAQESLSKAVKAGLDQSLAKWSAAALLMVSPKANEGAAYAVVAGQLVHLPDPTRAGSYLGGNSLTDSLVVLGPDAPIWQLPVNGLALPAGYGPARGEGGGR